MGDPLQRARATPGAGLVVDGRPDAEPPLDAGMPDQGSVPPGRGSLSADAIRRVIREHLPEVRHCYEQGLIAEPQLAGRVTIRFIISASGAVTAASIASSTLGNGRVEQCITTAVLRWKFPAPDGGGVVSVTYPFTLATGN